MIGRSIRLNRLPMTVIGITPASFHGIEPGALPGVRVPITLQAAMHGGGSRLESSGEWWLQIMGRLRPGVSRAQAADALDRRYSAFRAQFPWQESSPERLDVLDGSGGRPTIRRRFSLALVILTVLVAIVLALVCVNVGNLMLARSTARQREMSLRLALGAGRLRIVRQLLVEVSLLAAAGGALGLLLSGWSVGVLARLADAPAEVQIPTDFRVLAFATLVTFLTGVLSGLAPAWSSAKVDLVGALKIGTLQIAGSRTAAGSFLVAGQVALSLALLIGAGLFARTLFNLRHAGFGFQTDRLALVTMNPILAGYSKERVRVFFADVLERVTALPTVDSAAFGVMPLLDGNMWGSGLVIDNGQRDDRPGPTRNAVGPGFFRTTGLPLKEGREFTATDSASSEPVAIVNEAFVRRYLGDGSALGRRIGPGGSRGPARHTIVGVTRDSKITHVRDATIAFWYIPYAQLTNLGQLTLHVRATESPEAALRDVKAAIASIDPGVPLFQAGTMRQQIEDQVQSIDGCWRRWPRCSPCWQSRSPRSGSTASSATRRPRGHVSLGFGWPSAPLVARFFASCSDSACRSLRLAPSPVSRSPQSGRDNCSLCSTIFAHSTRRHFSPPSRLWPGSRPLRQCFRHDGPPESIRLRPCSKDGATAPIRVP